MLKIKDSHSIEKSMTSKLVIVILLCTFFAGCSSLSNSNSRYDRGTVKVSKKSKAKARAKAKAKARAKAKQKAQAKTKVETTPKTKIEPKAKAQIKLKAKTETKVQTKPKPKPQKAKVQSRPKFKPKAPTKYKAKRAKTKPKRPKLDQLSSEQLDSVYVNGGIEPVSKNSKKENQVREFVQKNEKQNAYVPDLHIKPTNIKPDQGINIPTNLDSNVRGSVDIEASSIN